MLPEHWHAVSENKDCAQKDEGWAIHWGRSYVVGEQMKIPQYVRK
jgi:hypothetical protein